MCDASPAACGVDLGVVKTRNSVLVAHKKTDPEMIYPTVTQARLQILQIIFIKLSLI